MPVTIAAPSTAKVRRPGRLFLGLLFTCVAAAVDHAEGIVRVDGLWIGQEPGAKEAPFAWSNGAGEIHHGIRGQEVREQVPRGQV